MAMIKYYDTETDTWKKANDGGVEVPVKGVQVAGVDLVPDEDGKVNVPVATENGVGVIRLGYGALINQDKKIYANAYNLGAYSALANNYFVGKGTLENIKTYLVRSTYPVASALPSDGNLMEGTEYRLGTITSLTINGFSAGQSGCSEVWSVQFTAGSTIAVTVPSSVSWAVATPVFEASKTYWLSFTSTGNGYIGVWSVA